MRTKPFLFLLLLLCIGWAGTANAATSNFGDKALLFGKGIVFNGNRINGWTDGSDSTKSGLLAKGNNFNLQDTLSPTQYVNRIYVRGYVAMKLSNVYVELTFVDGSKETVIIPVSSVQTPADFYGDVVTKDKMLKSFLVYSAPVEVGLIEFDLERGDYSPVDPKHFVIKNLAVTQTPDSNRSVSLSWDAVKSDYLDKYKVYDGKSVLDTKKNTIMISDLLPGQTHDFAVAAVDTFGSVYDKSAAVTYVVPDDPPVKPLDFGAMLSKDRKTIDLFWMVNNQSGFAGYNVYLVDGDNYKKLNSGLLTKNAFSFPVPGEETYKFAVETVDKKGNASDKALTTLRVAPLPVTETEQETGPDYLLVKWTKTEGATGYRIYLNGRLIGSVGPAVFEYKITRAMGYIPGAISNKAESRAILADGSEGGSNNPTAPVLELGAGYGVGDAFKAGVEFVKLLNGWVLIALSIVLANMIIAFLYLLNKKYKITQRG